MSIGRGQCTNIASEVPSDGSPNGCRIEQLALDGTRPDDVFGQGCQAGLVPESRAEVGEASKQQAMITACICEERHQGRQVILPVRPIGSLPDELVFSAIHAEIMGPILRIGQWVREEL